MIWDDINLFLILKILACGERGEGITPRDLAKLYKWSDRKEKIEEYKRDYPYAKRYRAEAKFIGGKETLIVGRLKKMKEEGFMVIKNTKKKGVITSRQYIVIAEKVRLVKKFKFLNKKTLSLHIDEKSGWRIFEIRGAEHDSLPLIS